MDTALIDATTWAELLGPHAWAGAFPLMVAVSILPIPAEAPAFLNGMLFGLAVGTLVTWGGALLGAIASFEIARRAGRPAVERWIGTRHLASADRVLSEAGWRGMLLARLVPLIAFTALNWGAGLCDVPRRTFVWTTTVGILPGALLFTAAGTGAVALADDLGRLTTGAGIAATAVLVVWVVRGVRRRRVGRTDEAG